MVIVSVLTVALFSASLMALLGLFPRTKSRVTSVTTEHRSIQPSMDKSVADDYIRSTLEESLKEDKGTGCDIPKTDPFAEEFLRDKEEYPPIECHGRDWVKCYLSTCELEPMILERMKYIRCTYRDIIYKSEEEYTHGPDKVLYIGEKYKLSESDHVEIRCQGSSRDSYGNNVTDKWSGHAAGFRPVSVKTPPPGRERTYNVLIIGFDSVSKNKFIREMPKSYPFLKNEFQATILNGYNIVAHATTGALFPILTGKTELEHPEYRRNIKNSVLVDPEAFIFHKLEEDGYRTAYFEDMPYIGTFQLRLNGFTRQPTDHYLRDFFLEVAKQENNTGTKNKPFCIGDTPQYQLMINLTDQFFKLDGKKYAFTMIADITHDVDMIGEADESLLKFLKGLMDTGILKDTLVMIMADHGPRYRDHRQTLQGKLEERLPLMAIRLPDEMRTQRPEAQHALEVNADVLTTPHDIYATVLDAVDMREHWNNYKVKGADLKRALTLLEPIPKHRSCSEAGIEPHWCSCFKSQNLDKNDTMSKRLAQALLDQINALTDFVRDKCVYRKLESIDWVIKKLPHQKFLEFQRTYDYDAYLGTFYKQKIDTEIYQIKITARPDNSSYEAIITHDTRTGKLHVSPRMVSRINAYNKESECISNVYPHITPYCYCTKPKDPILGLSFFEKLYRQIDQ